MTHVNIANSEAPPLVPYTNRAEFDANQNMIYEGWADPKDPDPTKPVWCMRKYTVDASGNRTLSEWADGNANFDNVYNDFATLTYK